MSQTVLFTIIMLSSVGILAAVILFFIAQKFKVYEDPRIDDVEEVLPAANCGGCGYAGCRNFAEALVKSDDISALNCPVGGNEVMAQVAKILGMEASAKDPLIAVLRCNGACEVRPKTNVYDGAANCTIVSNLYSGDTGCQYGCLGLGECVDVCTFDALYMDEETGLPVVDEEKCTACGACVKACPKNLFELRKKGPKGRRIYVACMNQEKGGIAKKSCTAACIGCVKCEKECKFDAIKIENFLAYIDPEKCKLCRKCAPVCPTNCILEINFPPKKEVKQDKPAEKPEVKVATKTEETTMENKAENQDQTSDN
ncbi:MAG: Fe-S cluster domain-containing protein [Bacteroidota bacterium]